MMLSAHFSLDEAVFSSTAQRFGIDNKPTEQIVQSMMIAASYMESVRVLLHGPVHIDSWYRCPALNAAVNGAKDSAHMSGYAVDFICPEFGPPPSIVRAIGSSGIQFDQCIEEGTWVHISFDPRSRHQIMTAHFGTEGTTYTTGIS